MKRDGDHAILETGTPGVGISTVYPERVTIFIGKKHTLRLTKTDAKWLGEELTKAANKD
jgi:hypothetical protein